MKRIFVYTLLFFLAAEARGATLQDLRELYASRNLPGLESAATAFLKITDSDDERLEAMWYRAFATPEVDRAMAMFSLLAASQNRDSTWVRRGTEEFIKLLMLRGSYQLASLKVQDYLRSWPDAPWGEQAQIILARSASALGNSPQAAEAWQRLQADAKNIRSQEEAMLCMGDGDYKSGDRSKAKAVYQLVVFDQLGTSNQLRLALRLKAVGASYAGIPAVRDATGVVADLVRK